MANTNVFDPATAKTKVFGSRRRAGDKKAAPTAPPSEVLVEDLVRKGATLRSEAVVLEKAVRTGDHETVHRVLRLMDDRAAVADAVGDPEVATVTREGRMVLARAAGIDPSSSRNTTSTINRGSEPGPSATTSGTTETNLVGHTQPAALGLPLAPPATSRPVVAHGGLAARGPFPGGQSSPNHRGGMPGVSPVADTVLAQAGPLLGPFWVAEQQRWQNLTGDQAAPQPVPELPPPNVPGGLLGLPLDPPQPGLVERWAENWRNRPQGNFPTAFASALVSEVLNNLDDEAVAGVVAFFNGISYEDALAFVRTNRDARAEDNPIANALGHLVGMFMPGPSSLMRIARNSPAEAVDHITEIIQNAIRTARRQAISGAGAGDTMEERSLLATANLIAGFGIALPIPGLTALRPPRTAAGVAVRDAAQDGVVGGFEQLLEGGIIEGPHTAAALEPDGNPVQYAPFLPLSSLTPENFTMMWQVGQIDPMALADAIAANYGITRDQLFAHLRAQVTPFHLRAQVPPRSWVWDRPLN